MNFFKTIQPRGLHIAVQYFFVVWLVLFLDLIQRSQREYILEVNTNLVESTGYCYLLHIPAFFPIAHCPQVFFTFNCKLQNYPQL